MLYIFLKTSAATHFIPGKKFEIVQTNEGMFFLLQKVMGTLQSIYDANTLEELYIRDPTTLGKADEQYLHSFTNLSSWPVINLNKDRNNPDDLIATIIKRSVLLQPPIYWKESYYLPGYFNPAFVVWHNHTLVAWRR